MVQSDNNAVKLFLTENVLKNFSRLQERSLEEHLALLKREKVEIPVIFIGMATCGIIAGAERTLECINRYLQRNKIKAEVVEVGCIGYCSAEPIMDVQLPGKSRISFRHVTGSIVDGILDSVFHRTLTSDSVIGQYRHSDHEAWPSIPFIDEVPFFSHQKRLVLKNAGVVSPRSIEDYLSRGGFRSFYKTLLNYTSDKVCEIVEQSELRGRGGAGYPTGKKWRVALNTASDEKYLICNADESDPGGFMNRAIIESDPFRIVEGLSIAAYAIGASHAFIYVRNGYERPVAILENALSKVKEWGFTGSNIFGSGFKLNISIRKGAGAFVCGEETALIESLEGSRGLPRIKPPYPAEAGYLGCPTVVNNIETLANLPAILENGPAWFRSTGSRDDRGTKLISLSGSVAHTGFIEVPLGMTISEIVYKIGGGVADGKNLKAVQIGGPSGVCIPPSNLDTEIGYESLKEVGANLGLGGLIVLDSSACMVSLSKFFIEFLHNESCGKCIPCREGTRRMLEILEDITKRPRDSEAHETLERFKGVVQLENLADVIRDTSLCGLGQNAPNPLLSSLKWFRDEYEEHIFDRRCAAGVCHDLRTFFIDPATCNGCNVCQKKCPEQAIIGASLIPHFIIEERCTGCGICQESCKFNAIYYK
jgi:NADH:ubiquinone oxidoreductase subunit F (NADH-binding)